MVTGPPPPWRPGIARQVVTPNTIRHTVITYLAENGVDLFQLQVQVGHTSQGTGMTGDYIHLRPGYQKQAIALLEDYFVRLAPLVKRPLLATPTLVEQPDPAAITVDLRDNCVTVVSGGFA